MRIKLLLSIMFIFSCLHIHAGSSLNSLFSGRKNPQLYAFNDQCPPTNGNTFDSSKFSIGIAPANNNSSSYRADFGPMGKAARSSNMPNYLQKLSEGIPYFWIVKISGVNNIMGDIGYYDFYGNQVSGVEANFAGAISTPFVNKNIFYGAGPWIYLLENYGSDWGPSVTTDMFAWFMYGNKSMSNVFPVPYSQIMPDLAPSEGTFNNVCRSLVETNSSIAISSVIDECTGDFQFVIPTFNLLNDGSMGNSTFIVVLTGSAQYFTKSNLSSGIFVYLSNPLSELTSTSTYQLYDRKGHNLFSGSVSLYGAYPMVMQGSGVPSASYNDGMLLFGGNNGKKRVMSYSYMQSPISLQLFLFQYDTVTQYNPNAYPSNPSGNNNKTKLQKDISYYNGKIVPLKQQVASLYKKYETAYNGGVVGDRELARLCRNLEKAEESLIEYLNKLTNAQSDLLAILQPVQ